MEKKIEKKTDAKFIGAGMFALLFTISGIVALMTKKNGYWVDFGLGGLSLGYLFYLINKTKENKNERYEDERKKFISERSSSISFTILFAVIVISRIIIERNNIAVEPSFLLLIIAGIAMLIKFGTYLFCRYKY